ncbi:CDP-glycerol glycerophosphotransferase family protein [uncultured Adlercreutzia sp.]|uniref:CDP-glycerol glycerophosphotransferase family protein n=1 Tax=uncultured Adlercreutzia sp. TaxID=875803 RepID=UPI0025FC05E1|nr:CDP-glycerol glycerophosphotransferase family protein [uncultured Adlercreutzia sp.]MCI9262900.1 CDP-glycerol glycerophosphotransferase family protein [Eggerthellaceae bacterium]
MKKLLVKAGSSCLRLAYHFCRLFPVQNRIVCISRQSDEAPLDFQLIANYCCARTPPITAILLPKQLRSPVTYLPEMLRQVYYIATSKAVVLDSYCIVVSLLGSSIEAPVVQIWHALGNMKKAGYTALSDSSEEGRDPRLANLLHMHEGYNAIAISSLSFSRDFAAVFNADPSIIFEAPLPRADLLTSADGRSRARKMFFDNHPDLKGKQVIVYCPTFRRSPSPDANRAIKALVGEIDYSRYALIYKPHPVDTLTIEDSRLTVLVNHDPDPLFVADYVVSDYSTVIYEAGLLNIPVFLYAYDWDSYREKRGLNIDLEHDVPTLFTQDPRLIVEAIENNDFDANAYKAFTQRNVALPAQGTCTEHLCEHILALAENR